ncbi:MAG TPA: metallophosphoesterase [Bacteroidales bacterium]|nr:metallophosphoesterase [Bacteroidales bacterium]
MMRRIIFIVLFAAVSLTGISQKSSFIVLGDIHYDKMENHDMDWLKTKPDDVRQVKEYTQITEKYWPDFISVLRNRAKTTKPKVRAIVQAGDISEGLAGTPEKAVQMANTVMNAVAETNVGVPWIIAKGNHDVTGPGAVEAFNSVYVPMIRKQTGNNNINNASYSYRFDNVQITCIDPWEKGFDMVEFLDKELTSSDAKFKFVVIHEPVIPVTERCWHTLRRTPEKREKLLETIAKNKAIVLCAHLHRYSVVSRNTPYGPIVQVMTTTVIKDKNFLSPEKVITEYGPSLVEQNPTWEPATIEERKKMLAEEAKFVTYYKQADLPGYSLIRIDEKSGTVILDYYASFGKKPYDTVNLTDLMKK